MVVAWAGVEKLLVARLSLTAKAPRCSFRSSHIASSSILRHYNSVIRRLPDGLSPPRLRRFSNRNLVMAAQDFVRIAIIGDVHGNWHEQRDVLALKLLKPDVVLFVGDFGEENIPLVRSVATVKEQLGEGVSVAVILGNHDAWFSMFGSSVKNIEEGKQKDGVQAQLDLLGSLHIGYGRLDLPQFRLSIVGGRPFSFGPTSWAQAFYKTRYGVASLKESAERIISAADGAPEDHAIIFMGHNGPSGLGSRPHDMCGKDFPSKKQGIGGDFGDTDFSEAIHCVRSSGRSVPLVVFGHMHHILWGDRTMANSGNRRAGNRRRTMTRVDEGSGITYINAAIVPRVIDEYEFESQEGGAKAASGGDGVEDPGVVLGFEDVELEENVAGGDSEEEEVGVSNTVHHFACVEVSLRNPVKCVRGADVWVRVADGLDGGGSHIIRARIGKQTPRVMLSSEQSTVTAG